jgi:hypothetical protein
MKNVYRAVCAAVLTCWIAANADLVTIKLTGVADNTTANFTVIPGSSSDMSGPTITNGTACTGLYNATVTSNGVTQQWQTYCIDPIGDININATWNATLLTSTDLTSVNHAGVLYAGSYGSTPGITQEKYAMISYLANQYYYNTSAPINTAAGRSDLSLAFWEIARDYNGAGTLDLGSGSFKSTSGNSIVTSLLSDAYNHRSDQIDLAVYRPADRPSQEFIAFKVPEPGTIGLLLTGLITLCGLSFARRGKIK